MMKKLLFTVAFAALALISSSANAQELNGAVKTNFFGMFWGQYQLAYEHALNEQSSVQLSAGLISRGWDLGFSEQKDAGFIVVPEYRYYFNTSMKGLYAGAFARYRSATTEVTDNDTNELAYKSSRSSVGGGIILGYQWIISDKLVVDLFVGPQYKSSKTEIDDQFTGDENLFDLKGESDGIGARFGLNIGIGL